MGLRGKLHGPQRKEKWASAAARLTRVGCLTGASTCQRLIKPESVCLNLGRRIRTRLDGPRASSSTMSTGSLAASTRGSEAHLSSDDRRRGCAATLLRVANLLVQVASPEVAPSSGSTALRRAIG
jgi:hypothetical protein